MPLREIDRQLLDRCLGHQPRAWNDFVDRYMGLIYHVIHHVAHARSTTISEADIEDIAAEVFLAIVDDDYKLLRAFKAESSLPTYLTVVVRRICVKEILRRSREAELGHAAAHKHIIEDEDRSEAEPVLVAEEVERMLSGLSERDAEVVRLYHIKYLNYRQISKQLNIPENSIGPILVKARRQLKRIADQRSAS